MWGRGESVQILSQRSPEGSEGGSPGTAVGRAFRAADSQKRALTSKDGGGQCETFCTLLCDVAVVTENRFLGGSLECSLCNQTKVSEPAVGIWGPRAVCTDRPVGPPPCCALPRLRRTGEAPVAGRQPGKSLVSLGLSSSVGIRASSALSDQEGKHCSERSTQSDKQLNTKQKNWLMVGIAT